MNRATFFFIATLIIVFSFIPLNGGCVSISTECDSINEGKPGSEVRFFFVIINDKQYNADIKAIIRHESNLSVSLLKEEFTNVSSSDKITFDIIVQIPKNETQKTIIFDIDFYDRPSLQGNNEITNIDKLQYQKDNGDNLTLIIIDGSTIKNRGIFHSSQVLLFSLMLSLFGLTCFFIHKVKKVNQIFTDFSLLPFIQNYTRLRKDRVLRNPTRHKIIEYLKNRKEGASFKEIQQEMGITHPSYLNYHLRRMMEFGFVRNVDNFYFHKGVELKRSFLTEIQNAIETGARTPSEVAARINSYPQKVRYHMSKHGLLSVCEIDYSKRKR